MATINRSLSARVGSDGRSEILLRVSVSRKVVIRLKSGVFIEPERFVGGRFILPRRNMEQIQRVRKAEEDIQSVERAIMDYCLEHTNDLIEKSDLESVIRQTLHPDSATSNVDAEQDDFFSTYERFINSRTLTRDRLWAYRAFERLIFRFELYTRLTRNKRYKVGLHTLSHCDVTELERFFFDEWRISADYPELYTSYPPNLALKIRKAHAIHKRGRNSWLSHARMLTAFYIWCRKNELTTNDPMAKYEGRSQEIYGTPYYLTIKERDLLADYDFGGNKTLSEVRDVFIFQCHVGCRYGDLRRFTKDNVSNGALEYIPKKTSHDRKDAVRVPLTKQAKKIIKRYSGNEKLLPVTYLNIYNSYIKFALKAAGINRKVPILDPVTGEEVFKPICEVASSHMARRTFIGNLYKKVRDPAIIGSMSGHKEGSKAFIRYREIDDDVKRDTLSLLE